MNRFLKKFKGNEDGVVSVEFAMIAPMLIFGSLIALNLGNQVNAHQKAAAAVAAGGNYLQDYALENAIDELRPNFDSQSGKVSETNLISNVKKVVQSAYGDTLHLGEIDVDTFCACPTNIGSNGGDDGDEFEFQIDQPSEQSEFDFNDPSKDFYTRTRMSLFKKGELCAFDCPEQTGRARVIMELEVSHKKTDLFGKEIYIQQKMKTRVR